MSKAVIFDFDGTLFDTMPIWRDAGGIFLARYSQIEPEPFDPNIYAKMTLQDSAHYMKQVYDLSMTEEEIVEGFIAIVSHFYFYEAQPKPGVPELLKRLKGLGVKLCITTASEKILVETALKRTGLEAYFDFVLTCTEAGCSKRSPEIFETALQRLNASKEETVVFEDSSFAVKTALEAGFRVIGVADAAEIDEAYVRTHTEYYCESFEDADDLIREITR